MIFTDEINNKLKELFGQKDFSKAELNILAELMTLCYEEGVKDGQK